MLKTCFFSNLKLLVHLALFLSSDSLRLTEQIGQSNKRSNTADYNGTTRHLKEIVIGRCYEFFHIIHKNKFDSDSVNFNCVEIWTKFKAVIVGKDPCSLKVEDFNEFLSTVYHPIGVNASLFWSGTYNSAHEITKYYNYWSLEDSLSGFLLNSLTFCSRKNSTDFLETSCPSQCGLKNVPYWNAASNYFAKNAQGEVRIVLNGTRSFGAVSNRSTFVNYELPEFDSSSITMVEVLLLHEFGKEKFETCANPKTLNFLKNVLEERKIAFKCVDNPEYIVGLFCFENPFSKECQSIKMSLR